MKTIRPKLGKTVMKKVARITEECKETAPGFFETRRRLLHLPAWLVASAVFGRAGKVFANGFDEEKMMKEIPSASADLEWEGFLKQCVPTAEELHRDSSAQGQEAYLHWLASMIARVRTASIPRAKLGRFGKLSPPVNFGVSYRGTPFFIV